MTTINMVTARYFQEDMKSVCEWITECRTKAYKSSEAVTRRQHKEKTQYSIAMGLVMLDGLFFVLP